MKLFVDTANLEELEQCLQRGFPSGVTTNPSILSKEQCRDFREHINDMIALLKKYDCDIPLSVEVFTADPEEMLPQAEEFCGHFGHYPNLNIKVPIGWDELAVIAELRRRGIRVNCTCCMSYNQAILAARAGANYVSLFWGRIRDIGYDAGSVVRQVHQTFREWDSNAEIIVGSIRHIADINEAMQAGADILTVPPKFFPQMCGHPKTDEAVKQFVTEFQKWQGEAPLLKKVA
ncbi:MAG TPA: transaldolase family protein [Gemmataceae bacterium]|nr:transaldolase family protein [Gemmataceae bacterium]